MQAVTCLVSSRSLCLAASAQTWKQSQVSRHTSFAGRQLRVQTWNASRAARGLSIEAKAVPVLAPVGDGATKHLDEAVDMPGEIRFESDSFVVGRTDDRSEVVLPVATVSGAHAKVEKKGDKVYVTDLESTNGTFVDSKKISANTAVELKYGSTVVFGDEHLAAFKLESIEEEEEKEPDSAEEESAE